MHSWFSIIPKSPWLSVYLWIVFLVMSFFFIAQDFSAFDISIGVSIMICYFVFHLFAVKHKDSGLVYMWISFQMALNIFMTLVYGYIYLSLFTAYFIGNIRRPVGFYIMYGLHIGFTVLSIVGGYFIYLDVFIRQTPFIIIAVLGVVLLPFTLFTRNRQENLESELETAKDRISELIIVEERQRIARDLHDTLGQKLSMIGLKSDLTMRLIEKDPKQAVDELKDIRHTASMALKEVRELVADMRAVRLSEEIFRVQQILNAAEIELKVVGDPTSIQLPRHSENVLSMCLKEAVNNVVKHSGAKKCTVKFEQNVNEIKLTIQDNGQGFTKQKNGFGSGLNGIYERVDFINGSLEMNGDDGMELIIHIPVAITHQAGGEKD